MITCRQLAELLIDYVSNELPEEHRARLEQHLHRCPPCLHYVESYHLTIQLTRKLPCAPLPDELVQRLRTALDEIRGEEGIC
jgi:anti-sigma factor RsiW